MKLASTSCLSIFFLCLFFGCGKEKAEDQSPPLVASGPTLFTSLSPAQSGVDFQNTLTEGLNTNILMYEYFYNGGGVAAGDLNGDGLIDLYFSANMSPNRLYLNQGGMKFQPANAPGLIERPGPWKTGVTMVDINGDNQLDIYLCYSGMLPEPKRANQLFINLGADEKGVPKFEEQAEAYGLASAGFSNQGYFFDYDRDGDLDMLLLNHNPKSLPILNEVSTSEFLKQDDAERGVRLFRQDKGRFTDVTVQAGISGSALSYGLGIGITDVNQDGWPDWYLSNDYAVPDYLYLNQQDGTFSNELSDHIGHSSHFSMGNDVADINNDGLADILTLDMLPEDNRRQKLLLAPDNYAKFDLNVRSGFHYQYMRNMLQLSNGNGTFSEIGQLAGISNTDWSWSALLADYDNDGWKDLYVTNGYLRDYTNLDFIKYMDEFVQSKGRLQREDVLEIIKEMPASNVVNYLYANQGDLTFVNKTRAWGLNQPSNSNGAAYADLDNDGDLDLVVNNLNQAAFVFQNESQRDSNQHFLQVQLQGNGLNSQGIGAKVELFSAGKQQILEQMPSRGYLSSVSPILHFGLGGLQQIDSLLVTWPTGKQQLLQKLASDQVMVIQEKEAGKPILRKSIVTPVFQASASPITQLQPSLPIRDFDRQPLLTQEMSFIGPCMGQGDVNGDGREDVVIGGIRGQATALYVQQANGSFQRQDVPAFLADQEAVDSDVALFDANGDGQLDLYVGSGGYHDLLEGDPRLQDRLYLNEGDGNFRRVEQALPAMRGSTGCVAVGDANGDGAPDLFVGGRVLPGTYPELPESVLLINDGKGNFADKTRSLGRDLQEVGMLTDAAWVDLNQDGLLELVMVGEWMPITIFGQKDGKYEEQTPFYLDQAYRGWWNTITVADLNLDQRPDLVLGNMGTNTQFQVSPENPAELYSLDFDKNGAIDPIFCFYIQGKSYPYLTRDELLNQLGGMRSRFRSYKSYADATIDQIFIPGELSRADRYEANHMETSLFLSGAPENRLKAASLPIEAQFSPVYDIQVLDYNEDGKPDLLLTGNNSHAKLRLGKFDANYGQLFEGDGAGAFHYLPQAQSGLEVRGDVRAVVQLGDTFLFGINQGGIVSYQLKK